MALDRLIDLPVIHFLNQYARQWEAFDLSVYDLANNFLLKSGIFMAFFWLLWFKRTGDGVFGERPRVISGLTGAVAAAIIGRTLQSTMKFHSRPLDNDAVGFIPPYGVDLLDHYHWSSFPSDHAVLFFALATAVWLYSRKLGVLAYLWTLLVICLPRLYLGLHYPTDIIGGAVMGISIMTAAHIAMPLMPISLICGWERRHPGPFYAVAFLATFQIALLFNDARTIAADGLKIIGTLIN